MRKTPTDSAVGADTFVAEVARRLHERRADVAADIHRVLDAQIPDLQRDPQVIELLGASIEGNVDTLLHAVLHGIAVERIEAPTAALEYARRLAQHGVPVHTLVRAYRLGQRRMNELVFAELRHIDMPDATRVAVIETMSGAMFDYIDLMSQQVVVVYENERERWLENRNVLRGLRVRELLAANKAVDVDAVTAAIRYPLLWHHVGLVIWYPDPKPDGDELSRLQAFVRELAEAAGAAAGPLFVPADRGCAWVWLPYRAAAPGVLAQIGRFARTRADPPSVAIGSMASGVEGFRRSHREAGEARAVAVAGGRPAAPRVIAASDPGVSVVARLGGDVAGTRDWVAGVLGDLAGDNENDERLRETLRVYLGCGCSYKSAAEELNLHFNSVKYRVGRALDRRGREITSDRLDVELALLACHWYGGAVLQRK